MKKIIFLSIILFSLFLLSCGKQEVNENEISLLFRSDPGFKGGRTEGIGPDLDLIQDIVAEKMPGTTLKLTPIQAPEGEYFTKVALALRNDSSYDIVSEDSFIMQSDVAAGLLEPLNISDWEDWEKFYPGSRESSIVDGKVYTIPWNTDARGLWFSKKLLKMVGISEDWQPKNWNDILDTARKIKALGNVDGKEVIPFFANLSRASGEATTMQTFLMLLYGTDDKLYENNKWVVESQGIMDSLRFLETLRKEDLILPNDILLTASLASYIEPIGLAGNIGIRLDGTWIAGSYPALGLTNWREVYGFTGMPSKEGKADNPFVTFQGGWGFSISAKSLKKEKALEVIKIITSFDSLNRIYQVSGHISTREDVAQTPEYQSIGVNGEASKFLEWGHYRPTTEAYPSISTEIQVMVENVMSGMSAEEAMKIFSQNVESIVGKENIIKKSYN